MFLAIRSRRRLIYGGTPRRRAPIAVCWFAFVVVRAWLAVSSPAFAQGFSPAEAVKRMVAPPGFRVQLVASEPQIRQPVAIYFDERGRIWVNQYLQYPNPAGLKPVAVDQYLRTRYDRVPAPPPRGPRGADRITICEDTNGDGKADKFTDFVAGLNLSTGLAIGYGGVFVMQAPYLLFYPDRNHDDIPDGDPQVLLTGFGIEDAHALANSLQWGPDGWLYGAQGSTVTAHIRGIEFQQGIWRYHPLTHQFELFAEGGGNTWGLDFDSHGNIIAGTNFGEQIALHQVQGAYYVKLFGKHGPLHNPYAYGYFGHIPYTGFRGGHVTCGGIVYQGGSFPASFDGAYVAANLLANAIYWHVLQRDGSSFKGHFGGVLLEAHDTWFRPVDCELGPDGAVYIADWYDKRATHLDPKDTWDRSNGRIYRIQAVGAPPAPHFNLRLLSSHQLVALLANRNEWFAREARRILAERRDPGVLPELRRLLFAHPGHLALEALWALYVSGGFNDELAEKTFAHSSEDVRTWTVRFLGDAKHVSRPIERRLVRLAHADPSPVVRNQLACSAKRLPGSDALPILRQLFQRDQDANDPQIPLLIWWALEDKAVSERHGVLRLFADHSLWQHPIVRQFILERLARRYAAEDTDAGFASCAKLLALSSDPAATRLLVQGIAAGLVGRRLPTVPAPLQPWFAKAWHAGAPTPALIRLGLRLGDPQALGAALHRLDNPRTPATDRVQLAMTLGQIGDPQAVPSLLRLLRRNGSSPLTAAALAALQHFTDPAIARTILLSYPRWTTDLRARARDTLASRPTWALQLVHAVAAGLVDRNAIGFALLRQMTLHHNPELDRQIEKRWGKIQPASNQAKANFINEIKLLLHPSGAAGRSSKGDPAAGHRVFLKTCALCHRLFGEGNPIGPDLTGEDRKNTDFLLFNIVNPSAYIRPAYESYEAVTRDGAVFTGLLADQTPTSITLLDAGNQRHLLPRDQIKELNASAVSLMPEGLLQALKQQEIINLFAYLQANGPLQTGGR